MGEHSLMRPRSDLLEAVALSIALKDLRLVEKRGFARRWWPLFAGHS
jgi:hypothetical protein